MTCRIVDWSVGCNARSLDLHVGSMVDVGQMAPKSAVLDPTCHTEGPSLTRWCACDPSSTGHEVPTGAHGSATGDICVCRGNDDIRNPFDHDVECIDSDITVVAARGTRLLVDDNATAERQRYRLIRRARHHDRLSVDHETNNL